MITKMKGNCNHKVTGWINAAWRARGRLRAFIDVFNCCLESTKSIDKHNHRNKNRKSDNSSHWNRACRSRRVITGVFKPLMSRAGDGRAVAAARRAAPHGPPARAWRDPGCCAST